MGQHTTLIAGTLTICPCLLLGAGTESLLARGEAEYDLHCTALPMAWGEQVCSSLARDLYGGNDATGDFY